MAQAADGASFLERIQAFEGQVVGTYTARDPVNEPMIRHWCEAVDDRNPIYTDREFAADSSRQGLVAPPTMLQAWTMPGLAGHRMRATSRSAHASLFAILDTAGFTSVVATNCRQEYARYLRPGDLLTVTTEIAAVSEEKTTALGVGHFVTQRMTYRDQVGDLVAVMEFRMLKFKPRTAARVEPSEAAPVRRHPRPGITHDNRFFWDGVSRGVLLIQRCRGCGELRHPPGPMCPKCHSLVWDTTEASGRGTVYSYVVAHHPPVPPFEYPNAIALVELEEGVRLVSNLVGIPSQEIRIGAFVTVEFYEADEGFTLHRFRPDPESR